MIRFVRTSVSRFGRFPWPTKIAIGSVAIAFGIGLTGLFYFLFRQSVVYEIDGKIYRGNYRSRSFLTAFPRAPEKESILLRGELWVAQNLAERIPGEAKGFTGEFSDLFAVGDVPDDWVRSQIKRVFGVTIPDSMRIIDSYGHQTYESRKVEVVIELPEDEFVEFRRRIDDNFDDLLALHPKERRNFDFRVERNSYRASKEFELLGRELETLEKYYVNFSSELDSYELFFDSESLRIYFMHDYFG